MVPYVHNVTIDIRILNRGKADRYMKQTDRQARRLTDGRTDTHTQTHMHICIRRQVTAGVPDYVARK